MAYFFNHIKGLTENSGTKCLTYIKWSNTAATADKSVEAVPTITNNEIDYGHIITQNAANQQVNYLSITELYINGAKSSFIYKTDEQRINYDGKIFLTELEATNFISSTADISTKLTIDTDKVELSKDTSGRGTITATGKIEGLYFNATSDRRAKTNIRPIAYGALDIIMNTPVYTFNYIKDNAESCGIMAQDLPEDYSFDFIDRSNPDLLKVHESKLVYLLWKALQEQQLEIKKLQCEIEELKNN